MVDEDYFYARIGQEFRICKEWRDTALAEIRRMAPEVVIVGSSARYDFTATQWIKGSGRVFDRLTGATGAVLVIPGNPALGFDGPGCVSRHHQRTGRVDPAACRAHGRLADVEAVSRHLAEAVSIRPSLRILDLNDLVCPQKVCPAVSPDGVVVYRDQIHISDTFVRSVTADVRRRVDLLLPSVPRAN